MANIFDYIKKTLQSVHQNDSVANMNTTNLGSNVKSAYGSGSKAYTVSNNLSSAAKSLGGTSNIGAKTNTFVPETRNNEFANTQIALAQLNTPQAKESLNKASDGKASKFIGQVQNVGKYIENFLTNNPYSNGENFINNDSTMITNAMVNKMEKKAETDANARIKENENLIKGLSNEHKDLLIDNNGQLKDNSETLATIDTLNLQLSNAKQLYEIAEDDIQRSNAKQVIEDLSKQLDELNGLERERQAIEEYGTLEYIKENGNEDDVNEYKKLISHAEDNILERGGNSLLHLGIETINTVPLLMDQVKELGRGNVTKDAVEELERKFQDGEIDEKVYAESLANTYKYIEEFKAQNQDNISQQIKKLSEKVNANTYYGANDIETFILQAGESTAQFLLHYALFGQAATVTMSLSAAASQTDQLLASGKYDIDTCAKNGALTGLVSYIVEKIGMDAFVDTISGGGAKIFGKLVGDAAKTFSQSLALQVTGGTIKSFLAEGLEEVVEGLIDPYIDSITLGTEYEIDGNELLMDFLLGGTSGGLMGFVGGVYGCKATIRNRADYNKIKAETDKLKALRMDANNGLNINQKIRLNNTIAKGERMLTDFATINQVSMAVDNPSDAYQTTNIEEDNKTVIEGLTPNFNTEIEFNQKLNEAENKILDSAQKLILAQGINMSAKDYVSISEKAKNEAIKVNDYAHKLNVNVAFSTKVNGDGLYNPFTNQIIINPNSNKGELSTLVHEITHNSELSEHYGNLAQLVKEEYKGDYEEALDKIISEYKKGGVTLDRVGAESEFTAIRLQELLGNDQFVEKLVNYNESFAYRILRNVMAMSNSDIKTQIENAFMKAYKTPNIEENLAKGKPVQMSMAQYDLTGKEMLKNYLYDKRNGVSKKEANDILNRMDEIYKVMKQFKETGKFPEFSNWQDTFYSINDRGDLSVVISNGEYDLNIDFSTVCKKRKLMDKVINSLSKQGFLNAKLKPEQIEQIRNKIQEHGFEVACGLCFVDAKRFNQGNWAGKFETKWNGLIDQLAGALDIDDINTFEFSKGKTEASQSLANINFKDKKLKSFVQLAEGGKEINRMARAIINNPELRAYVSTNDMYASEGFSAIKKANPKLYELINASGGSSKPKLAQAEITYMSEVITNDGFTPEEAKKVGGVRVQSFSDFMCNMVFDYVQMFADLEAKKLTGHSYTKVKEYALLFGKTGMKINLSIIPAAFDNTKYNSEYIASLDKNSKEYKDLKANAGLDENGNYIFDKESFDWDLALEIQNLDGYDSNVGTICVGVSDKHIEKLLNDDNVCMVIPYHRSGINDLIATKMGISLYNDYTLKQNTRFKKDNGKAGKKVGKAFDFDFYNGSRDDNGVLHRGLIANNYNAKKTAKSYLAWCESQDYVPKFDKFANNPNYYKLLIDFRAYDKNGNVAKQEPIKISGNNFGTNLDTIDSINYPKLSSLYGNNISFNNVLEKGLDVYEETEKEQNKELEPITKELIKDLGLKRSFGVSLDYEQGTYDRIRYSKGISLEDIENKYKDKTNYLYLIEHNDGSISIDNINVKKEFRNQGIGQSILNDVINYADENNKIITLTPTNEFGTQNKLKKWYKDNGFVENKGRNANYRLRDTMYREPQSTISYSKGISLKNGEYIDRDSNGYFGNIDGILGALEDNGVYLDYNNNDEFAMVSKLDELINHYGISDYIDMTNKTYHIPNDAIAKAFADVYKDGDDITSIDWKKVSQKAYEYSKQYNSFDQIKFPRYSDETYYGKQKYETIEEAKKDNDTEVKKIESVIQDVNQANGNNDLTVNDISNVLEQNKINKKSLVAMENAKKEMIANVPKWVRGYDTIKAEYPNFSKSSLDSALYELFIYGKLEDNTRKSLLNQLASDLDYLDVDVAKQLENKIDEFVNESLTTFTNEAKYLAGGVDKELIKQALLFNDAYHQNDIEGKFEQLKERAELNKQSSEIKQDIQKEFEDLVTSMIKNDTKSRENNKKPSDRHLSNWMTIDQVLREIAGGDVKLYKELNTKIRDEILNVAAGKEAQLKKDSQNLIIELNKLGIKAGTSQAKACQYILEGHTEEKREDINLGVKMNENGELIDAKGEIVKKGVSKNENGEWLDENGKVIIVDNVVDQAAIDELKKNPYKPYTIDDLKTEFPDTWENIQKGANLVRESYFDLYKQIYQTQVAANGDIVGTQDVEIAKHIIKMDQAFAQMEKVKNEIAINGSKLSTQAAYETAKKTFNVLLNKYNNMIDKKSKGDLTRRNLTPFRENYSHHIQDRTLKNTIEGIKNADLLTPTELAGISDYTKPNTAWASFSMAQEGGKYDPDIIKSYVAYVNEASSVIANNPVILQLRQLNKVIRENTKGTQLNRFAEYINDYCNMLAGKRNGWDRIFQKDASGIAMRVVKEANKYAKAAALAFNFRSGLVQLANIPNGLALLQENGGNEWVQDIANGMKAYVEYAKSNEASEIDSSAFVTNRFFDFKTGEESTAQTLKDIADFMITKGDEIGTKIIWFAANEQAKRLQTSNDIANPILYADNLTRDAVAGRSKADLPMSLQSELINLLLPFQVESNNLWQLMKRFGKERKSGAILTYGIAAFIFNQIIRFITGGDDDALPEFLTPIYEEIKKGLQGEQDANDTIQNMIWGEVGEFISLMPVGSQLTSLTFGDESETIFGDYNPSRYGMTNIGLSGLGNTLLGIAEGKDFREQVINLIDGIVGGYVKGGKQLTRTVKGLQSMGGLPKYTNGKVEISPTNYTKSGKVAYVNDQSNIPDWIRAALFGKYSTSQARKYIDSNFKSLSSNAQNIYNTLMSSNNESAFDNYKVAKDYQENKSNKEDNTLRKDMIQDGTYDEYKKEIETLYKEYIADFDYEKDGEPKSFTSFARSYGLSSDDLIQDTYDNFYKKYNIKDEGQKVINKAMEIENTKNALGKEINNSASYQRRKAYEQAGIYDDILDFIKNNGLEYSDFGLTKTVVGYDDEDMQKMENKIKGISTEETNSKSSTSSTSAYKKYKKAMLTYAKALNGGQDVYTSINNILNNMTTIEDANKKVEEILKNIK